MNNQTIVCFIVALLLGMLLAHMLKNVCGCKVVEGSITYDDLYALDPTAMTSEYTPDTIAGWAAATKSTVDFEENDDPLNI